MKLYISKNVLKAFNNEERPILTDLIFCKRGAILMNSRDIVHSCEMENCQLDCEVRRGARATLEEVVSE